VTALSRSARTLRAAHVAVAVVELSCLAYLWWCAMTGRRDRRLWAAVATLAGEGVALVIGRGDCPLGPLQEHVGDPTPLFELVLPPRAAKAAVPIFAGITMLGLAIVLARGPFSCLSNVAGPDERAPGRKT
jgi:hypothetical protein